MLLDRDEIIRELSRLKVPGAVIGDFPVLPRDTSGLLIYGSRARADAVDGSDHARARDRVSSRAGLLR